MTKTFPTSLTLRLVIAANAIALCSASASLAQTDIQSGPDRAQEAQIKGVKAKIDNLQAQLRKLESAHPGGASGAGAKAAKSGMGCCAGGASSKGSGPMRSNGNGPEGLAQASPGNDPSSGAGPEHPMGGEGGMGAAGATPGANPGSMPMEEHMKGMQHMHRMMHGGASPAASPGAMGSKHPTGGMGGGGMGGGMGEMKGGMGKEGEMGGAQPQGAASPAAAPGGMPMEHNMGSMGGGGMEGGGMQGGTGGAQPEASPSAAMGGMNDDM